MGHPTSDLLRFSLGLFLFERIDQFDRGEEAPFAMMLDSLDVDRGGNVGFGRREEEKKGGWTAGMPVQLEPVCSKPNRRGRYEN